MTTMMPIVSGELSKDRKYRQCVGLKDGSFPAETCCGKVYEHSWNGVKGEDDAVRIASLGSQEQS